MTTANAVPFHDCLPSVALGLLGRPPAQTTNKRLETIVLGTLRCIAITWIFEALTRVRKMSLLSSGYHTDPSVWDCKWESVCLSKWIVCLEEGAHEGVPHGRVGGFELTFAVAICSSPCFSCTASWRAALLRVSGCCSRVSPFRYRQSKAKMHTLTLISSIFTSFLALVLSTCTTTFSSLRISAAHSCPLANCWDLQSGRRLSNKVIRHQQGSCRCRLEAAKRFCHGRILRRRSSEESCIHTNFASEGLS